MESLIQEDRTEVKSSERNVGRLIEDQTDQELLDRVSKLEKKLNDLIITLTGSLAIMLISLVGVILMYFL
jgi:hypothetical protein